MKNQTSVKKCKCLMVTTLEIAAEGGVRQRKFFTKRSNAKYLVEFAKSFGASLKIVNLIKGTLLDIASLINQLATESAQDNNIEFEEIETLVDAPLKKNEVVSKQQLATEIEHQLIKRKKISLKELHQQYCDHKKKVITDAYTKARKHLTKQGWRITKMKRGIYLINE